jgi:hypothetical protein
MLHFRDARHAAFFLQRVRLHERFGRLEELRVSLEKAVAEAKGFIAKAIGQYFEWKSGLGGCIHALNHLAQA